MFKMGKYLLILTLTSFISAQEIDTLYYYDPDSLDVFSCAFTDDVSDFGVYFVPNEEWESYSIEKIEFLIPDAEPYNIYEFAVANGTETKPDSNIYIFQGDTLLGSEIFPHWKTIDLSSNSVLKNLTGNFWVKGVALAQTFCNLAEPSGHSYAYLFLQDRWAMLPTDYTVRAIIEKNNVNSLNIIEPKNLPQKPALKIYPNPFNSITKIELLLEDNRQRMFKAGIYNIRGDKVKAFTKSSFSSMSNVLIWDGKTNDDKSLSSGIYFFVIRLDENWLSQKIILLK